MIHHPAILGRLHAAASSGSIAGWTPAGIAAPDEAAQPAQDEPEPPLEAWMERGDYERSLRHWREGRKGVGG